MTFFEPHQASLLVFQAPYEEGTAMGRFRDVSASKAADEAIAASGQAGGTVTALLTTALQEDMIDCAILTGLPEGEAYPRGVVAHNASEILACAGSRYVGAHSLSALREALDRDFQKIAVVGLPCQVKSVRKMALYDLKGDDLRRRIALVVGLFCNWAFSSREFIEFLSSELGLLHVSKLHIPPPPANVVEVETGNGVHRISLDRLRPLIQAACAECTDMTSEFADVSVGMYEGKPGWNTLITRTDTGERLVRRAVEKVSLHMDEFPAANLKHLMEASANKKSRGSKV
jgi:coenzyme F420 hydrogenase subunit beta